MLILKSLLIIFYISFNLLFYFFTIHCWLTRKTLKLGFSEKPASWFDMFIITVLPIGLTFLGYILYELVVLT